MKLSPLKIVCKSGLVSLGAFIVAQVNADTIDGLSKAHLSDVDPSNENLIDDIQELKPIGSVTALIPEASTADEPSENSVDGQSGDTDFPFAHFKAIATVGEYDPETGLPLTGYPDGQAAWLLDEDTIRVTYQSESYAFNSNETYSWTMANGATFTGSHIHTIDYDRAKFADFLSNDSVASEMFKASGNLFDTVYNVFGNEVKSKDTAVAGEFWGKQSLADGTLTAFSTPLVGSDYYFQSFCGAHYEQANRYGAGLGFADDVWLTAEEWNIGDGAYETALATDTMGLASVVVDVANSTAYTVPALGQSGYEKFLPMNPGHPDYVVIICAGYNFDLPADTAPLRIYVGMKGIDADGNAVDQGGAASERDKFLARNGLLYGKLYGMALADADHAALNIDTPDADEQNLDAYLLDETAPDTFSVRYYPTSYQWAGWGIPNAVSVGDTEVELWLQDGDDGEPDEQPAGYTFFSSDDKVEHPAVDPDITKFRYVQNMTQEGALLGVELTDLVAELTAGPGLPDYISADVRRIIAAPDGSLELEVANKGISHDGSTTAAIHVEAGAAKMVAPDGLQWIKTADADVLIVDEDSGNDYGERKYAIVLDPETLEMAEPGRGYLLAMAGGNENPRAINGVSAYGNTFWRADSSEFSGSWNVTGLVAKKGDGTFYTQAELAGTGEQSIIEGKYLHEQTLIGVVQHRGESYGPVQNFRADWGGQVFMFDMCLPTPGLQKAHLSAVDSENENFASDVLEVKTVGEVTAQIPEASTADEASENSVDGEPGDQDYPYVSNLKPLATVGEIDPKTGYPLTGYPDGQAAWLADEDTVRVAYQSESYAFNSNETYPWMMANGASFTGSHIHTIDYDRSMFADFLNNDSAASEMFKGSGKLFHTVYNVFGNEVKAKDAAAAGEFWGKQSLVDGTATAFSTPLVGADYYFQSFCGAFFEQANRYGDGIGFADDAWLCAEEWNIGDNAYADVAATETMGLASVVVDIANNTAYTVPALGQSGYEKLMPVNPGHPEYVVIVAAGYNFDLPADTAPLKIYVGKKGVDANGDPVDQEGTASERDKFLARNGLLYGKLYGMALADADHADLNIETPDADEQNLDAYLLDETAPDTFSARYYPTSFKWAGWGIPNAVAVGDTEVELWLQDGDDGEPDEQPEGYTYFCSDDKVEHPAVDPDITKFRYVQNMTQEGALLGIEFTDLVAELTATDGLPEYVSAEVRRIIAAPDGTLELEVGDKGVSHDGSTTASVHVEAGAAKMVAPDGLHWIRTADADVLIVDEDSGNDYGERKYALVLDPETLELANPGKGHFLAMAGGNQNPRATNGVSAYGGTFWRADSSEFSGTWNVTGLVAKKSDGSFYTQAELAGTGEQEIIETYNLDEQKLIGVVQHRGESAGPVENFRADWGGQVFMFGLKDINPNGGQVTFDPGTRGSATGGGELMQNVRAGQNVNEPTIEADDGWVFLGWDTEFDSVSGDTNVTAQYAEVGTIQDIELEFRTQGVNEVVAAPGLFNLYTSSDVSEAEEAAKTIVNVSTRVELGDSETVTPGFVVIGEQKTLLIRAVGPKLADLGVGSPLADPTMTLFKSDPDGGPAEEIAVIDDWKEGGADVAAINDAMESVGAFPLEPTTDFQGQALPTDDTASSAVLVTLDEGVYTVIVSSADATVGEVLVEVYEVTEE